MDQEAPLIEERKEDEKGNEEIMNNSSEQNENEQEPPLLESFEWLPKFKNILIAFSKKRPVDGVIQKVLEDMSYFKPALHDIAFTRFSSKACIELAKVIIDHGTTNNYMFWIEIFEPYVVYDSRYEIARIFLYMYVSRAVELKNVFFNSLFLQYALCLLDEDTYPNFMQDLSGVASNQDQNSESLKVIDEFAKTTQNYMKFKVNFCNDILVRWTKNFCYFEHIAESMNSTFEKRMKRFMSFPGCHITFRKGVDFDVPSVVGSEEMERFKKQWKNFRRHCYKNSLFTGK